MTPETLSRLHACGFPNERSWTAAEFANLLSARGSLLTGDDRCFVLGRVVRDEAEVLTLVTDPEHRRQGLARQTLATFEGACAAQGVTHLFLDVAEDNLAACTLYRQAGYQKAGRRAAYYQRSNGTRIAALVLSKDLPRA